MISDAVRKQYTVTIGIECHVQLKTATKLFSAVGNDAREAPPNTLVSHIDFGLPGALPVLNAEAVHLAARAAFALNAVPQKISVFDRKHYFYPDLPKGYQITQLHQPIILNGSMQVQVDGQLKSIYIERAHIEEDAGKSTHPAGKDYSLVDLNRAGTPLLEIVSGPDMHSAAEAKAYAHELYLAMRYADVSDANLYYGNMRFDVNVSVSKTKTLGTRTETKNINSFRAVEKVIEYETMRQIEALEKGALIVQETRGWDDAKQRTFSQRTKEDAHDYRYFPDPDIPPIVLSDDYIAAVQAEMPVLPAEWRQRLHSLGLDYAQVETLLDAQADFDSSFLQLVAAHLDDRDRAKTYANWLVNIEIPLHREDQPVTATTDGRSHIFDAVYSMIAANKLSSTNAKALLGELLTAQTIPADIASYAETKGYVQESDEAAIMAIVTQVLQDNQPAANDVKSGEMKAIGFLVGQVMKATQGKANPALAQQLIKQVLDI